MKTVAVIQARFFEKAQLRGLEIDADTSGAFCRYTKMDAFVVSGTAVLAGLKTQAAFEEEHVKQACMNLLHQCTRGGGCAGVKYMRERCGLQPLQ